MAWHAPRDDAGEADRWVWVTRSNDDGKTFSAESAANPDSTGACGCCSLKISADANGKVNIVYRAATQLLHRDTIVLTSADHGKSFRSILSDYWQANACVMSTSATSGSLAAWETRGQIRFAKLDHEHPAITDVPGPGRQRKHPAIAINKAGDFVIVWAEGTGWNKGGGIGWQLFDHTGRPSKSGSADGLPVWSQPTVFAKSDGSFGILY